jgi:hypothetical protein
MSKFNSFLHHFAENCIISFWRQEPAAQDAAKKAGLSLRDLPKEGRFPVKVFGSTTKLTEVVFEPGREFPYVTGRLQAAINEIEEILDYVDCWKKTDFTGDGVLLGYGTRPSEEYLQSRIEDAKRIYEKFAPLGLDLITLKYERYIK